MNKKLFIIIGVILMVVGIGVTTASSVVYSRQISYNQDKAEYYRGNFANLLASDTKKAKNETQAKYFEGQKKQATTTMVLFDVLGIASFVVGLFLLLMTKKKKKE